MLSPARIAFTHIGCSVKKPLPVSQVEVGRLTVRTRLSSRVRIVEVAVLEVLMQDSCVRADSHHSVWRVDYHTLHVFDLAALQAVEVPDETRCESHAELAGDLAERFCLKWCEIQARQDLPEFTLQHVCGLVNGGGNVGSGMARRQQLTHVTQRVVPGVGPGITLGILFGVVHPEQREQIVKPEVLPKVERMFGVEARDVESQPHGVDLHVPHSTRSPFLAHATSASRTWL